MALTRYVYVLSSSKLRRKPQRLPCQLTRAATRLCQAKNFLRKALDGWAVLCYSIPMRMRYDEGLDSEEIANYENKHDIESDYEKDVAYWSAPLDIKDRD